MKFSLVGFGLAMAVLFWIQHPLTADDKAEAATPPKSFFLIGNSLTWDAVPPKLDADVQWHVGCGKSLPFLFENPADPCVKSSTLWPKALKEKQYDVISVQPHYGSTLLKDATVISEWMKLQPNALIIIHTGWARSADRAAEWSVAADGKIEKMLHSAAYYDALIALLEKNNPGREIRRTMASDLLAKVASDVEEGKAPFKDVAELYRDAIHMNVVTGRYLMHNAMRHALGQPRSAAGFEKLPPELKTYFDGLLDSLDQNDGSE